MKVLWITNILFPEAAAKIQGNGELRSSGGWMLGAAENLIKENDIELYVATVSSLVTSVQRIEGKHIVYYVIPCNKSNLKYGAKYWDSWVQVESSVKPDIVHIYGTECEYGYEYMLACGTENVVVSIQGMTTAYYPYYHYGISKGEIYRNLTLRDVIKGSILKGQRNFKFSSKYEISMLMKVNHIIGRTSWDYARTWAINPNAQYHFCNETLRPEFYDGSLWDYATCSRHSIFLSQAGYPIKGLHQVLKAMPLILKNYPDTILHVAGYDITKISSLRDFLRLSGYGKYIRRLIKRLKLKDRVIFTGNLNAEEMKKEYLSANVFVCPSSIENSPNSLGEAQILGVPCLATYVGGVPDMMTGCEDNLYRFEEVEMLAHKICCIFMNQDKPNLDMVERAKERHNPYINRVKLYSIYRDIIEVNAGI